MSPHASGSRRSVAALLGPASEYLLAHTCRRIRREDVAAPGPDFVDRVWTASDRSPAVLASLQRLFSAGRLGGTGYLSILPVDHGVAYGAGSVFAPNPRYFEPENVVRLAVEAGCSALVTTFGVLGSVAHRYAHVLPLILKLNHDEQLTYPPQPRNDLFARVEDAWNIGCVAVGATVYFGSRGARAELKLVSELFSHAHALGMATVLFCYLRNAAFVVDGVDHELAWDMTGQANHLGVTIEADLIKQKQAIPYAGFPALDYPPAVSRATERLVSDHPIDLVRYQVLNCYAGRCGLVNSGGASGRDDMQQAVRAAVINKRAGGMGLIAGRKAFQAPVRRGVALLQAIQDVYLDPSIDLA